MNKSHVTALAAPSMSLGCGARADAARSARRRLRRRRRELDTLEPEGPVRRQDRPLFAPVGYIALVVLASVFGAVLFMWFRFRVDEHAEGDWPEQVHGNTKLEYAWTVTPAAHRSSSSACPRWRRCKSSTTMSRSDITVVVVGQQWWWEFRYYLGDNAQAIDPAKVDKIDGQRARPRHGGPARHPDRQRRTALSSRRAT